MKHNSGLAVFPLEHTDLKMSQIFKSSANSLARVSIILAFGGAGGRGRSAFRTDRRFHLCHAAGRCARTADPVQPCAPRRFDGDRLPLLPHVGREFRLRHGAADQDLHELPFADLDQQPHAASRFARASAPTQSINWTKVYDLPDFVYFNHSIHVKKGVGCETCHGRVDTHAADVSASRRCRCAGASTATATPRSTFARVTRSRRWDTSRPSRRSELGARLVKEYHVQKLETCWTCHR